MRGKKPRKIFSRNTRIVGAKNIGKKIVSKYAKKRFLQSYECRDKKMGGKKMRETIFPETHE